MPAADPHADLPLVVRQATLPARAGLVLVHGRGASAADILTLADELPTGGFLCVAPQAAQGSWYPYRFLVPAVQNEPWLSSALAAVERAVAALHAEGIPAQRTLLLGFSQGACLALEYARRNPARYGGVVGLSGALIGADGEPRHDHGDFGGTPVFLGCADDDPHIPWGRVEQTAANFQAAGATVLLRQYPGMGHTVNADELVVTAQMMAGLLSK